MLHQLTTEPGFHTATVSPTAGMVADCYSSVTCPLVMRMYRLDAASHTLTLLGTVTDSAVLDERLRRDGYRASMVTPVFHTVRSTDGKVDLHCALYLPKGVTFDPSARKFAIVLFPNFRA